MTIQAICIFLLKGLQTGISLSPGFLQDGKSLLLHRVDFLLRNNALLLQATCIDFAHGWMRTDDLVHLWLREYRFVALVVSPAAITYQVDKDIFMKLVAVGMSHTHRHQRSIWIIGIHMDNGDFKTFRQVARKVRGAIIPWLGRKAKLVVHNDMDGPAYRVALQVPQVQGLSDYPLAREGCISMNKQRQRVIHILLRASGVISCFLRGSCHTFNHGVHELQVAGIGRKRDLQLYCSSLSQDMFGAQVIFDIAGIAKTKAVGERNPFLVFHMPKLAEDCGVGLLKHMREHVQASSMRHAYNHLAGPGFNSAPDDFIQHRHQYIGPLEREAFLAGVGLVQEALKRLNLGEPL